MKLKQNKGNVVAVIPARGGSKGVPRKNIRLLAGKPLIAYTIEAALQSKMLDRVIVSTDDEEIARIAKKYGAEVPFMRPADLATDTAHTPPVIEHAVSWLEENENYPVYAVVILQPTSPLRTAEHIDTAIEKFLKQGCESLISIKKGYPPWWLWEIHGERIAPFIEYKKGVNPRDLERQQLPAVYCPDGAIYVMRRDFLKKAKTIINASDCGYVAFDEDATIDIDSEIDFKIVEEIIKKKNQK